MLSEKHAISVLLRLKIVKDSLKDWSRKTQDLRMNLKNFKGIWNCRLKSVL